MYQGPGCLRTSLYQFVPVAPGAGGGATFMHRHQGSRLPACVNGAGHSSRGGSGPRTGIRGGPERSPGDLGQLWTTLDEWVLGARGAPLGSKMSVRDFKIKPDTNTRGPGWRVPQIGLVDSYGVRCRTSSWLRTRGKRRRVKPRHILHDADIILQVLYRRGVGKGA